MFYFHWVTQPNRDVIRLSKYFKHVSSTRTDNACKRLSFFWNGVVIEHRGGYTFAVGCFSLLKRHFVEKAYFLCSYSASEKKLSACLPERSKGSGLGPDVFSHSRVQTPQHAYFLLYAGFFLFPPLRAGSTECSFF